MTAANAAVVNQIAPDFNASQNEYPVVPVFKGSYAETMNAGIATFRAGKAPDIVQVFEVGTATMMAAEGAVMPVYQRAMFIACRHGQARRRRWRGPNPSASSCFASGRRRRPCCRMVRRALQLCRPANAISLHGTSTAQRYRRPLSEGGRRPA